MVYLFLVPKLIIPDENEKYRKMGNQFLISRNWYEKYWRQFVFLGKAHVSGIIVRQQYTFKYLFFLGSARLRIAKNLIPAVLPLTPSIENYLPRLNHASERFY